MRGSRLLLLSFPMMMLMIDVVIVDGFDREGGVGCAMQMCASV
jgi:hypothetical protein